jgi:Phytanoyl-CoA dioxygenase (PhyH)
VSTYDHLLPTPADVDQYVQRGWYLSKKIFTDDEIDRMEVASEAFYSGRVDRELPLRPTGLADWMPEDGAIQRMNDYIHYRCAGVGDVLLKPVIGQIAAILEAVETMRVFMSTLILKPADPLAQSNVVAWHFDKYYWSTCSSTSMTTAFIPFHDCSEAMGTIEMIEGSHLWGKRTLVTDDRLRDVSDRRRTGQLEAVANANDARFNALPVTIPKGHMTFHNCLLFHGSGHNRSDQQRRAISLHLQDGGNVYQQPSLSGGRRVAYKHDELVRKLLSGDPDYADPEFCPLLWPSETVSGSM